MPEHEAYRPQSEHASEQPQNPSALETGHALPRPENEVASNPRIMALMQERDTAERRLQEAILDLETREQSPAFQKAEELFGSGLRLFKGVEWTEDGDITFWLVPEANLDQYTYGSRVSQQEFAYPVSVDEEDHRFSTGRDLYQHLDISSFDERKAVLDYMVDLTQEASSRY